MIKSVRGELLLKLPQGADKIHDSESPNGIYSTSHGKKSEIRHYPDRIGEVGLAHENDLQLKKQTAPSPSIGQGRVLPERSPLLVNQHEQSFLVTTPFP